MSARAERYNKLTAGPIIPSTPVLPPDYIYEWAVVLAPHPQGGLQPTNGNWHKNMSLCTVN